MQDLNIKLIIDGKEAFASLKLADSEINKIGQSLRTVNENSGHFMQGITNNFADIRNAVQGIREGWNVISEAFGAPVNAFVQKEQYQMAFSVLLGSMDNAKKRMAELTEFAKTTPFELPQVVSASKQLEVLTHGALSTGEGLRMVGDAASAGGVGIEEIAMWFGRLYDGINSGRPVGEAMMRLQELGLVSSDTRNKLEELTKEGKLQSEGWALFTKDMGRFTGLMDKQSGTLGGKISNLSDSFGQLEVAIGGAFSTPLSGAVSHITELLSSLTNVSPALSGIIGAIGILGFTLLGLNATGILPLIINVSTLKYELAFTKLQFVETAAAEGIMVATTRAAGTAFKGFFTSLGPVGWAILGVTVLAEAVNLLKGNTDEADESTKNEINSIKRSQVEFNTLVGTLKDTTSTQEQRNSAIERLQSKYPSYLHNIDLEKASVLELANAQKIANNEFERNINLKVNEKRAEAKINELVGLNDKIDGLKKDINKFVDNVNEISDDYTSYKGTNPFIGAFVDQIKADKDKIKELSNEIKGIYGEDILPTEKTNKSDYKIKQSSKQKNKKTGSTTKNVKESDITGLQQDLLLQNAMAEAGDISKNLDEVIAKLSDVETKKKYLSELEKKSLSIVEDGSLSQDGHNKATKIYISIRDKSNIYNTGLIAKLEEDIKTLENLKKSATSIDEITALQKQINAKQEERNIIDNKLKELQLTNKSNSYKLEYEIDALNKQLDNENILTKRISIQKEINTKQQELNKLKNELEQESKILRPMDDDEKRRYNQQTIKKDNDLSSTNDYEKLKKDIEIDYAQQIADVEVDIYTNKNERILKLEEQKTKAIKNLDKQESQNKMQTFRSTLNFIAGGMNQYTAVAKAAAAFEAGININVAATEALKLPVPLNFIAVAAVLAAGAKQVYDIIAAQPPKMNGYSSGGIITGSGSGTSDEIPALLSNGEYIINANSVKKHKSLLDYINFGIGLPDAGFNLDSLTTKYSTNNLSRQFIGSNLSTSGLEQRLDKLTDLFNKFPTKFKFVQKGTDLVAVHKQTIANQTRLAYEQ